MNKENALDIVRDLSERLTKTVERVITRARSEAGENGRLSAEGTSALQNHLPERFRPAGARISPLGLAGGIVGVILGIAVLRVLLRRSSRDSGRIWPVVRSLYDVVKQLVR